MKKLQARKQYEQSRLDMMQRYASTRDCRRKLLLGYFGEAYDSDNCGACDQLLKSQPEQRYQDRETCRARARKPLPIRRLTVTHRKWGAGTMQTLEDNTVTVHFPDVGYKTLALDIVLSSGYARSRWQGRARRALQLAAIFAFYPLPLLSPLVELNYEAASISVRR